MRGGMRCTAVWFAPRFDINIRVITGNVRVGDVERCSNYYQIMIIVT